MRCPSCSTEVTKPARQGGVLVRNAYLRLDGDRLIIACPSCKTELETQPGKLIVLLADPRHANSSSTSSANARQRS